jgi:hypothetical protein
LILGRPLKSLSRPSTGEPCILVGDKGYHSREGLKDLDGGVWKTRIAEPKPRQWLSALAW